MQREKSFRILEAFLPLFSHLILKINLLEAGDVAQLGECLPDMHKTLGLIPELHIVRVWWCRGGEPEAQGHLCPHSIF